MSTSLLYHAFGLRTYDYVRTEYCDGGIIFHINPKPVMLVCPNCRSGRVIGQGRFSRVVQTVPIGLRPVWLHIDAPRVKCLDCGSVRRIDLGIVEPKRWHSKAFESLICSLSQVMSLLDVARILRIGWDGVKRVVKSRLLERFSQPPMANLKYLAIDEISVQKGHKYLTLVMNLETGQIIFVGDGKGAEALAPFWERLGKRRLGKIQAVATDLGRAYISAVTENLPNAKLVFDHFHVVKLMNEQLTDLRRKLFHEVKDIQQREVLKGTRWILLKRPENLKEKYDERHRLAEALTINEPLATAYYMKESLRQIWDQPDREIAAKILNDWIKTALISGISPLMKMGKTLAAHRYGILNWYDHPISSGQMEGTNNKIKTLKRQAYGFRDMQFFKLRILAIHEAKYSFTG
jgi:transposase